MAFSEGTVLLLVLPMHFSWFFQVKYIVRHAEKPKIECHVFPCRPLLLSTAILNDM